MGYFPTYALGNLYASQLYNAADKDLGDLHAKFRKGSFDDLRHWLKENIHAHGRRYPATELVERVTAKAISAKPLLDYLKAKFYPLYGVS